MACIEHLIYLIPKQICCYALLYKEYVKLAVSLHESHYGKQSQISKDYQKVKSKILEHIYQFGNSRFFGNRLQRDLVVM